MPIDTTFESLVEYTAWERQQWRQWLSTQGDAALAASVGPNGDGRFGTVGEVVRHIFSAEKRYVDRLSERPLTEAGAVPADKIDPLFAFGEQSRSALEQYLTGLTARALDTPNEYKILSYSLSASPRKILTHVLLHEIRHWAQIATTYRLSGRKVDFHDFLFSPALGGQHGG